MERDRVRIERHGGLGLVWLGGWLFTIGYLDLPFWRAVIALVIWPYHLGVDLAAAGAVAPAAGG